MRKLFWILGFVSLLLCMTPVAEAAIKDLPKPIKSTFLQVDFTYNTSEEWQEYFDDLKSVGINTVIFSAGGIECGQNDQLIYHSLFDRPDNTSWESNPLLMVLRAAHRNNFQVFLSLPWAGSCLHIDQYNDQTTIIEYAKKLIGDIQTYYGNQGWNWNSDQMRGFYITQELDVRKFDGVDVWEGYRNFYDRISNDMKTAYPTKKILLSPYFFETDTYQVIYNNILYAVKNWDIDYYAPQDSVGTSKVRTYQADRTYFEALKNAITDGNQQTGKTVEAWANVESFACPATDCGGYPVWPAADFKRLSWQIRAVDDLVTNMITWIHQWSMTTIPMLNNYGENYYKPEFVAGRTKLKADYQSTPIIEYPFAYGANYYIKGYNFGSVGDKVVVYIRNAGTVHRVETNVTSFTDPGETYSILAFPLTRLPNFDENQDREIAVQNLENKVGYYKSYDLSSVIDPVFDITPINPTSTQGQQPTVTLTPTTTLIPTPTDTQKRGDANGDGKVDIYDLNIILKNYGKSVTTGVLLGDLNADAYVDIHDFREWLILLGL